MRNLSIYAYRFAAALFALAATSCMADSYMEEDWSRDCLDKPIVFLAGDGGATPSSEGTKAPATPGDTPADGPRFIVDYEELHADFRPGTKADVTTANLGSFYLCAAYGGTPTIAFHNRVFTRDGNAFLNATSYWPASDPGYSFFASNIPLRSSPSESHRYIDYTGGTDLIYASLASPAYKQSNTLTFHHACAKMGGISVSANYGTATLTSASITACREATFDIVSESWSAGAANEAIPLGASNAVYLIPGTYSVTVNCNVSFAGDTKAVSKTETISFFAGQQVNITLSVNSSSMDFIVSTGYEISEISASPSSVGASGGTSTISGGTVTAVDTYYSGRTEQRNIGPATLSIGANSAPGGSSFVGSLSAATATLPSLHTTELSSGNYTVTASYPGAASKTCLISQAANIKTLKTAASTVTTAYAITLSPSSVPATGGNVTVSGTRTQTTTAAVYQYSSGDEEGGAASSSQVACAPASLTVSPDSGVTVNSSTSLTVAAGGAASWTVTGTYDGASGNATLTREADTVTDSRYYLSPISASPDTVTAAGGSCLISGGKVCREDTYLSGRVETTVLADADFSCSYRRYGYGAYDSYFRASYSSGYVSIPSLRDRISNPSNREGYYVITATLPSAWSSYGITPTSYTCNIVQTANSRWTEEEDDSYTEDIVYSYGTPEAFTISSGMTVSGGSATVAAPSCYNSMARRRVYRWRYVYASGSTSGWQTDYEYISYWDTAVSVNMSMTYNGNNRFSFSYPTITHQDMGYDYTTDTVTITAANSTDPSKTSSASVSIENVDTGIDIIIIF